MSFISFNYLLMLCITFIVYYIVNNKYKHWVIFLASIFFIISISINLLVFTGLFAGLNYFGGLFLHQQNKKANSSKILFWILIGLDIGILVFYKYINFVIENINNLQEIFHLESEIDLISLILPIGISYYTFQSIGYIVRVNRGLEIPEKNFIIFTSFLIFFPKFLSGPVERSNHFLPQLKAPVDFDQSTISVGLRLILLGAFKKMVIADNLYGPVSIVYSNIQDYSGISLILVLFIQIIYIYCDFSGYTDMALGSAKILGINLIDNFNRPFFAKSISEFWKRWHISLSSWCNEFIFIPFIVKYRKFGNLASILGIFLTFITIGIWHGANWTYIVLGLLQALAIIYEFFTKKHRLRLASKYPKQLINAISRVLVFIFMAFSMIFFFSNSTSDAWYFISHLFKNIEFKISTYGIILDKGKFLLAISCFLILFIIEMKNEKGSNLQKIFLDQPRWVRWTTYYALILLIYFFNNKISTFVYINF